MTSRAKKGMLLAVAALSVATQAHAHPGHGLDGGFGLVHYLLDPAHGGMLPVAVVLGAGALVWLVWNRRPRLRPARAEPKAGNREPRPEER